MRALRAAAIAGAALLFPLAAQAGTVEVEVDNVRSALGHVRVAICLQASFLKDRCEHDMAVVSVKGTTIVRFENIPPGEYAAQGYLDEKDWGEVRRDLLGFPEQGIGFSNDAPLRAGPPKWADARFTVGATPIRVRMTLRYFTL
jgi:uncharacterized protein (DUF2141 family)